MGGSGVIDNFLGVFTRYIDSGFGLLGGEVGFIATTLIVIDVTLAALFWSWGADDDVIARLVKKTLFVGVFAYLISNWNSLAKIVFESFSGLGLKASGTGFSAQDLMRPGKVAQTGLDAARPLLESISDLMGWIAFFENFIQIACLLFAWALVILAFFILAIQLFVTLIEFKLSALAGFVLIPFGLFGKTAFMAERVLGNVISSGIKVLVLAVVIGIGSTLFSQFTQGFGGRTPSIDDAMTVVLAALSLLGLGIFGPGIANGLVSGVRSSAPARALPSAVRPLPLAVARCSPQEVGPRLCPAAQLPCVVAPRPPAQDRRLTPWASWSSRGRPALRPDSAASPALPDQRPYRHCGGPRRARRTASSPASLKVRAQDSRPLTAHRRWARSAAIPPPFPLPPLPTPTALLPGRSASTGADTWGMASAQLRMRFAPATATALAHPSISPKVTVHELVQAPRRPLRQDATTRDAYQKAAQIWDERIGSARAQAKNWRLMAFGSLIQLAILLA